MRPTRHSATVALGEAVFTVSQTLLLLHHPARQMQKREKSLFQVPSGSLQCRGSLLTVISSVMLCSPSPPHCSLGGFAAAAAAAAAFKAAEKKRQ